MIAKEAWMFVIPGKALMILFVILAARFSSYTFLVLSMVMALLALFTIFFFRDPERIIPEDPMVLVSPADGTIVAIDTLEHVAHIDGPALKVSIFLSVFNVHINRTPAGGTIDYVKYVPGKFFKAFEDKASLLNEQTEIGMTTTAGYPVVFKQIAGIIARRIVWKIEEGDQVAAGDRFGLIRFGSRMDLIFPKDSELAVKMDDKVVGGETIMAYLPKPVESNIESQVIEADRD